MILRYPPFQRLFSSLPAHAIAPLPSRALLHIHGPDAQKFLHALTAATISASTSGAVYTVFLTPQGRVLFDTFIHPLNHIPAWRSTVDNSDDPAFLIEADAAALADLQAHIRRYKLRSKFLLRPADEWTTYATWGGAGGALPATTTIRCVDPRGGGLGGRTVLPASTQGVQTVGAEDYTVRRMLHGVAEGRDEIVPGVALPLESNVDLFGGVDFRKGCYVGQELTIRTKHTGVVRKRILPVALYPAGQQQPAVLGFCPPAALSPGLADRLQPGAAIKKLAAGKRPVGKWLRGAGNIGLALCRLEAMTRIRLGEAEAGFVDGDEFVVEGAAAEAEAVRVKAFVPEWMQSRCGDVRVHGNEHGHEHKHTHEHEREHEHEQR